MIAFKWLNKLHSIEVVISEEETLNFSAKTWSRAKISDKLALRSTDDNNDIDPCIFDTLNNHLATLPIEKTILLGECYKEAFDVMDEEEDITQLDLRLSIVIESIFSLVPWDELKSWCLSHGNLNLHIGVKEELGEKDSQHLTYLTEDYQDLVIFSILLKLIMPIWGHYYKILEERVDNDNILISAINLIRNDYTSNNPAFLRLEQYVHTKANEKSDISGFSIIKNIGQDEIPEFMFSLVIWKKVCIFDGHSNESIIKNVHAILKDRCDRLAKISPQQKSGINDRGEEMGITDMYKVMLRIPLSIEVMTDSYINMQTLVEKLEPNLEIENVINKRRFMSEDLEFKNFHIPILAAVMGHLVGDKNLALPGSETLRTATAIASEALKEWGFLALSELIVAVSTIKGMHSFDATNVKLQIPISNEKEKEILHLYRFWTSTNPLLLKVEEIFKEVNMYIWKIEHYDRITIELADLFLLRATRSYSLNFVA